MVYENCRVYGLLHKRTVSYPKYLVEKHLNRYLDKKSPRISDKDIRDAHFEIIEEKMKEAMAEIMAEEDRQLFALARRASRRVTEVI